METTRGAIIAQMLQQEDVEKFFGIVDGTYTQLFAHCVELGMEMITPRHEAVAAHMAGAYARLTGRLGACMASNGPGVANLLPGLVVEQADDRPAPGPALSPAAPNLEERAREVRYGFLAAAAARLGRRRRLAFGRGEKVDAALEGHKANVVGYNPFSALAGGSTFGLGDPKLPGSY